MSVPAEPNQPRSPYHDLDPEMAALLAELDARNDAERPAVERAEAMRRTIEIAEDFSDQERALRACMAILRGEPLVESPRKPRARRELPLPEGGGRGEGERRAISGPSPQVSTSALVTSEPQASACASPVPLPEVRGGGARGGLASRHVRDDAANSPASTAPSPSNKPEAPPPQPAPDSAPCLATRTERHPPTPRDVVPRIAHRARLFCARARRNTTRRTPVLRSHLSAAPRAHTSPPIRAPAPRHHRARDAPRTPPPSSRPRHRRAHNPSPQALAPDRARPAASTLQN